MARGGFPMGGNMNNMMKQAQKMQQEMLKMQQELEEKVIEASAGGGAVNVKVSGKKQIVEINLSPDVVDPDDIEMLQDLIMVAVNDALNKIDEEAAGKMGKLTGGMSIPGLF